jgi:hypothetical protein
MANNHPGFADFAQSSVTPGSHAQSGTGTGGDPTTEPGNYEGSNFGIALPPGTGAPGSAGAAGSGSDPTNQPGQLNEGLSGEGPPDTDATGSPGSAGAANNEGGPDSVSFTLPGSYLSGTYTQETVADAVSGTQDWTQAIDNSYPGSPQLPGIQGNAPAGTGAGGGRVMRGGRAVG